VLGPDKQKLSKRKGALPMTEYAKRGYLQEAVFNAIAMIGWNPADPGSEQELFSVAELVSRFDFERVQKSSAVFNEEKLNWFNREYVKKLPLGAFIDYAKQFLGSVSLPDDVLISIAPLLQERISYFAELPDLIQKDFAFLLAKPVLDSSLIPWKESSPEQTKEYLTQVAELFRTISGWDDAMIRAALAPILESVGKGPILWPLRYGLTGQKTSPDPFTCANLLGQGETIARIEQAIAALS
jgi:glutamyl/glutaminyl-tRNA synthetase